MEPQTVISPIYASIEFLTIVSLENDVVFDETFHRFYLEVTAYVNDSTVRFSLVDD